MKKVIALAIFIFLLTVSFVQSQSLEVTCEAGGPYVRDGTVITIGNVTQSGSGTSSEVTIEINKSSTIHANKTVNSDSEGAYATIFTESLDVGTYTINATANKSGVFETCTDTFEIKLGQASDTCTDRTIQISGTAVYSDSGLPVSSGRVVAAITAVNAVNQNSFTNGEFSVSLNACVFLGSRYIISVLVEDDANRRSWTQVAFVAI